MNKWIMTAIFAVYILMAALAYSGCADVTESVIDLTRPTKHDVVFFFKKGVSDQLQKEYLRKNLSVTQGDGALQSTHPLIESIELIEFRGHNGVMIDYRENADKGETSEFQGKLYFSEVVFRVYTNAAESELERLWEWSDKKEQSDP